jgi:transcriptional regulator with XRE-family HTH domain
MDTKKIGQRIADLRKKKRETQAELAEAIGVTQSAVTLYENGLRTPSDVVKKRIAEHFKVSVARIFFTD